MLVLTLGPHSPSTDGAFEMAPGLARAAVVGAFGIEDAAELPPRFEVGRPETGATCLISLDEGVWTVRIPLVRTPTSVGDLAPALVAAAQELGCTLCEGKTPIKDVPALVVRWEEAHRAACARALVGARSEGSPLPPHLPLARLTDLHGWLLACAAAHGDPPIVGPIYVVVDEDGNAQTAVRLPRPEEGAVVRLPGVDAVLCDLVGDGPVESPLLYPLGGVDGAWRVGADGFLLVDVPAARTNLRDAAGADLTRMRVVTPVEVVDTEALLAAS